MAYIGPEPNPGQNREVDDISSGFNGNTASFTLQVNGQNVSPGSANAIIVSLGGVVQNPGTDYTIAASTITFTTNPASGLSFFGLVLGQGIDTEGTADGSITLAKFVNGTSSNNGKFLRANNGAAPSFETVSGTTINNNADNKVITGSDTANTLEGEANLIYTGANFGINEPSPVVECVVKANDANESELQILAGGNGKESNILFGAPDDGDVGAIKYDHNGDHMKFITGASERMRLNSNGLQFGGSNGANHALNDYEEGTFSPTLRGNNTNSTGPITGSGRYTKVGRMVYCIISFTNKPSSDLPSGEYLQVHGLPFSLSGSTQVAPPGMNYKVGFSTNYQYYFYLPSSGTLMWGYYNRNADTYQPWGTDQWRQTSANIYHENSFTYETT